MIVLNTDLDNTIIYSYKHDIGEQKRCVEIYQGREISFITKKTYELLQKVKKNVLLVPTTTRTVEQYERIDMGIGTPEYALTCNGGVLLVNGVEDEEWYKESCRLVENCKEELKKAQRILLDDSGRTFEVRNIRGLFIFTKSETTNETIKNLKASLDISLVDVFNNGIKVYVVPKTLSKGVALERFCKRVSADKVIAAGDSEFDLPMLRAADVGLAPDELAQENELGEHVVRISSGKLFSEELLQYILDYIGDLS